MKSKHLMIFAAAMFFASASHSASLCLTVTDTGKTAKDLKSSCTNKAYAVQYVNSYLISASNNGGSLEYPIYGKKIKYIYTCNLGGKSRPGEYSHFWFADDPSITAGSVGIFGNVSRSNKMVKNGYEFDLEYHHGSQDRINSSAPKDIVEIGSFAVRTASGVITLTSSITQIGKTCKVTIISNASNSWAKVVPQK